MPDRDQADTEDERDLALFALVCLAAVRAGALEQAELLQIEEAVRGLQHLAEHDDVAALDADDTVTRMAEVWKRYGPSEQDFRPEWAAALRAEHRTLGDALALATATVNYWERGPSR